MSHNLIKHLQHPLNNQQGAYILITALALVAIVGFAALGIEVGRWYTIQGEMSKAIDGAAFAGAKNVNNPNIADIHGFVQEVAQANFPPGLLGTDTPSFLVSDDGKGKITVEGATNSINSLSKVVSPGHSKTAIAAEGSAKLRTAEIALVLDVSGSMAGNPIANLKDGAKQFVENFKDQENDNKFALVTFASGVQIPFNLDSGYVSPVTSAINGLNAVGGTNAEDALGQALALPWADQSGIPANERSKQVVVFFSDGNPTAFRGQFKYNGTDYNGVAAIGGSTVWLHLQKPNMQFDTYSVNKTHITGDGKTNGSTSCPNTTSQGVTNKLNTRWYVFNDSTYGLNSFGPMSGYSSQQCNIPQAPLANYLTYLATQMAVDHASAIRGRGIEIYTIGLGNVDPDFLESLSSGSKYSYYTTDPSELEGIFQQIANILKLVLTS